MSIRFCDEDHEIDFFSEGPDVLVNRLSLPASGENSYQNFWELAKRLSMQRLEVAKLEIVLI